MELEDKLIETLQVLKGIAEAVKRESQEKNNSKIQEQLKDMISGFKQELEKGNTARAELSDKLNEVNKVEEKEKSVFSSLSMRDPKEAFENAIKNGLKNPEKYMYMNSEKGKDYFKHVDTGNYKEFNISKESLEKSPIQKRDDFLKSRVNIENKINEIKDKAIKLAKDNNIEWATCKEYQPRRNRDSITNVLDEILKNAKEKVQEENKERSKNKVKEVEKSKGKEPSKGR